MSATGQGNETIRAKQKAVIQAQQQEGIETLEKSAAETANIHLCYVCITA